MALAGRGALGLPAQAQRLYRSLRLEPEIFSPAAHPVRQQPAQDQDAVRLGLPAHSARPLDQRLSRGRLQAGGSRPHPQAERHLGAEARRRGVRYRPMTAFPWIAGVRGDALAAGKRLEAVAYGPAPAEASTIIMLHEGLGCVALWRDFPQKLAAATGWGVFAYSRAGYGGSESIDLPRPLDYMSREARASLPAVIEAIGFRRGVLLGHSDGASIAAIHAGEHSDERIQGLVLMAPHLFTEEAGLASIAEARLAYEAGDLRAKLAKYHAHVDIAFRGWNEAWLDPGFKAWNIE